MAGIVVGQVVVQQPVPFRHGERTRRLPHFQSRQAAVENFEVIDSAILETTAAKPCCQGERLAVGKIPGEPVLHDLRRRWLTIEKQLQARGVAGAVVGDADVQPLAELELFARANLDGVARPEVNQCEAGVAVFQRELITLIGGVRTGLLMVQYDHLGKLLSNLEPEAEGEFVRPLEVRELVDAHGIFSVKLQGLPEFPRHNFRCVCEFGGIIGAREVRGAAIRDRVKRVVADQAGGCRKFCRPFAPALELRRDHGLRRSQQLFLRRYRRLQLPMLRFLRVVLVEQHRRSRDGVGEVRVKPGLIRRIEEREEPVVILLRDGIVLVVVAAGALHRQTKEGAGGRVNAVGIVLHAKLLIHAAPFVGLAMVPVEGRGQPLLAARTRQQVARDLPDDEVIEAHVAVEGADHPVAPRPHVVRAVGLIAVRVRVARHVQPLHRHPFAVG